MFHVGGGVSFVEEPQLIYLPLWREALTGLEYLHLKTSRVYYGYGVPQGDGAPVVVVPGFMACDLYLIEMRLWLARIGYRAERSRIGVNAECPEVLIRRLLKTVGRVHEAEGRKVHLVGHSLGGVLARTVAYMAPDKVASVLTLGSPFRGVRVNPFLGKALAFARRMTSIRHACPAEDCFSVACSCAIATTLKGKFPSRIRQTAIYSKKDGVVDWQTCINDNPRTDIEVDSTHVGMAWNAEVYEAIAQRLALAAHHK